MQFRLFLVAALMLFACAAKKKKPVCIAPPPHYGQLELAGCINQPEGTYCAYAFQMLDQGTVWGCAVVLRQEKCGVHFKPEAIHCEPMPEPPGKKA